MKSKIYFIELLIALSILSLESHAQNNLNDSKKQERLWRRSNFFKPTTVSDGFVELYKKTYDLSAVDLPFVSYKRIYPTNILHYDIILHSKDCFGDQISTPIAMMSADDECIVYTQVLSQYREEWKKKSIEDLKILLAKEIRCNKEGNHYWEDITEEQVKQIFDENIIVYENDSFTKECNADGLLLCHFPFRDKVGVIEKGNYYSVHEEYTHFYTLIIYKMYHIPIKMNLFLTDNGFDNKEKYLHFVCNSIRF